MANEQLNVIVGIDKHADTHHVGVITNTFHHMVGKELPTAGAGYPATSTSSLAAASSWPRGWRGPAATDAEVLRVLVRKGIHVVVMRPTRQARGLQGKSDRSMPTRPRNRCPYPQPGKPKPQAATVSALTGVLAKQEITIRDRLSVRDETCSP